MSVVAVDILADSPLWGEAEDWRADVETAVAMAAAMVDAEIAEDAELSLLLTDDAAIRVLNRDPRGFDKPTNVLSFPAFSAAAGMTGLPPMLGDIVLASETVTREAGLEGKPLDHHLSHLIAHGLLHLLGQDHETEAEAEAMEALETKVLASMGVPNPYSREERPSGASPG